MGKPAARIGDEHVCPKATPGTPPIQHVGGPVVGPGCPTVLIEGRPAARLGDVCFCVGEPDTIATGSSGVFIGGLPAARLGDSTEHGGKVITGCTTVLIGAVMGGKKTRKAELNKDSEKAKELTPEEKNEAIEHAIAKSIVLLENKLKLLEQNDQRTLISFKRWFGQDDEEAKRIILERMRKAFQVSNKLTVDNFKDRSIDQKQLELFAEVYETDRSYTIYVNHKFWNANRKGKGSRTAIVIHELSHFDDIGNTQDYIYGGKGCLLLAKLCPEDALYNAENFEYFIMR